MKPITKKIAQYKFEDSKLYIKAVIAGNVIFAGLMLFTNPAAIVYSLHIQICLLSAIGIFIIDRATDWETSGIILGSMIAYLGLVGVEVVLAGLPEPLIPPEQFDPGAKGFFLDFLLWILPGVYLGVRVLLAVGFLLVLKANNGYQRAGL